MKKAKKEKNNKKRKSVDISEASLKERATSKANDKSPTTEDIGELTAKDVEGRPFKKRKASVEEIEVDVSAPEPPSKKALRLLKKGIPLPPSKAGADSSEELQTKTVKPEAETRSEHGVWIGNLSWSTSKDELKNFLVNNSSIKSESITRIHMPGPNESKNAKQADPKPSARKAHNKGFAYVDFTNAEEVQEAVALSERLLGGRRLLIKNSDSFEGRPEKKEVETVNGKAPNTRIFIGNLGFDATEEDVTQHFSKCGAVQSVKLATFEDSGKCKGYGWVVFEELEAAKNAIKGFVMIEEEASESDEDGQDEQDGEQGIADDKKISKKATKQRKWWVNRMKGRTLRMEYAEDAQTRYKKRYGKDGTKRQNAVEGPAEEAVKEDEPSKVKAVEYRQPYAPQLTGGIVESKGKKTVF